MSTREKEAKAGVLGRLVTTPNSHHVSGQWLVVGELHFLSCPHTCALLSFQLGSLFVYLFIYSH